MRKLTSKEWVAVAIAIVVIIIFFFGAFQQVFFSDSSTSDFQNNLNSNNLTNQMANPEAVAIREIVVGRGEIATAGTVVTVHYLGKFQNGQIFDSSPEARPFQFPLGAGAVIRGWDIGVEGMRVGGKREITIQPEYAYGTNGIKDPRTGLYIIPPDSVLIFEVELLSVSPLE